MSLLVFLVFILSVHPGWTESEKKSCQCFMNMNANLVNFNFHNCLEVILNATEFHLNGTLLIEKTDQITIRGSSNSTTVQCSPNSGIIVKHVAFIEIYLVQFQGCGLLHTSFSNDSFQISFLSAVYVFNITKLSLYGITVTESNGTGLVILNSNQVEIIDSKFKFNRWKAVELKSAPVAGGGGVHIEVSCRDDNQSVYSLGCQRVNINIVNTWFLFNHGDNISNPNPKDFGETVFTSFGKGGGLAIHFRDHTADNIVHISKCLFHNNSANYGGGINLVLSNKVFNTSVDIHETKLENNYAKYSGGGLDIGFVEEEIDSNTIKISSTSFLKNCAKTGGSASLFFISSSITVLSSITFSNSQWIDNTAHYGAVLFVYTLQTFETSLEPKIQLENNIMVNNAVFFLDQGKGGKSLGDGIIMTTKQKLEFTGYIVFQNNKGSCIYATSSNIYFNQVEATFLGNSAEKGAGLYMIGFSSVVLSENTTVMFCNNSVSSTGSAIYYYPIDKISYVYSRFCFIQMPVESENITIYFFGNSAPNNSIYVKENLQYDLYIIHAKTYTSCLDGNFHKLYKSRKVQFSKHCHSCEPVFFYNNTNRDEYDPRLCNADADNVNKLLCKIPLSSQENNLTQTESFINFIPGIEFKIPLQIDSDFCGSSSSPHSSNWSSFDVSIENSLKSEIKSSKSAARTYSLAKFSLNAIPGNTGRLILTETGFRKLQVSFNIKALPCPPLFMINENKCMCISPEEIPYPEFHKCSNKKVELRLGFWIGYEKLADNSNVTLPLLASHCPPGFCSTEVNDDNYLSLPDALDLEELNNIVCDSREEILCGKCTNSTTVYFHTEYFKCSKTDRCYLGPLLYLLSEVIPLTVLFLMVIFFDIRFTSGYLNGFIFFAQMYNTITHTGSSFIKHSSEYHKVSVFHRTIYKFFDFDFFSIDTLSFCLFKTDNTLDIVSFKYVTVIYALLLVFGTAWFLNKCSAKLYCRRMVKLKYSVLQGFSAFLVMVYSQCTQVSFMILNVVKIYKPRDKSYHHVPFFRGNIAYFSKEHLPYAIPALICISTIVLAVPMLLTFYPMCNKIIVLLKLDENRFVMLASKLIPLSKFKPLFDSMQGSFKDHLRFFAGLYFLYRVAIIATVLQARVEWIHTLIEIEIIIILSIHTVLWPYRENIHNIMDALVFCNLLVIVILKRFTFSMAEKGSQFTKHINILHWCQIILINLPLLVISFKLLNSLIVRIKLRQLRCCQKRRKPEKEVNNYDDDLDNSILDHCTRVGSFSESYMEMKGRQMQKLINRN